MRLLNKLADLRATFWAIVVAQIWVLCGGRPAQSLEEHIKSRQVWLAEEGWVDRLENRPWDAFGYQVVGFFVSEEAANAWADEGGVFTREDCWAVPEEGADKRRVTLISRMPEA